MSRQLLLFPAQIHSYIWLKSSQVLSNVAFISSYPIMTQPQLFP